jgi:uncharacterized Fe-S cluster protein YjdI
MNKEIKKEYSNGELTVVWKPDLCIHSGVCVQSLPDVYKPHEKPWIKVEKATTEALVEQINKCPSRALSYFMNNKKKEEASAEITKVDVMRNGPLLVHGAIQVIDAEGETSNKDKTTAFCRCGQSETKPYCDGAHRRVKFQG